jgi:hypothetical protein
VPWQRAGNSGLTPGYRGAWFLTVGRDLVEEADFFHGSYDLDLDDFGEGYLALTLIILEIIIKTR